MTDWIHQPSFLMKNKHSPIFEDSTNYWRLIGLLIHLLYTRPDSSYNASILSQFSNALCQVHQQAAIHVLQYLGGIDDYSLPFRDIELTGYSNADWAGEADTRWSTSCYCFLLGSSLISWKSMRQNSIFTSSYRS